MNMKKTINVTIGLDGTIEIEAHNFKGASCEKATKFLEDALGVSGKRTKKPEYFQQETTAQKQST